MNETKTLTDKLSSLSVDNANPATGRGRGRGRARGRGRGRGSPAPPPPGESSPPKRPQTTSSPDKSKTETGQFDSAQSPPRTNLPTTPPKEEENKTQMNPSVSTSTPEPPTKCARVTEQTTSASSSIHQPQGNVHVMGENQLVVQRYQQIYGQEGELYPMKRPGYGTRGRPVKSPLSTNHFEMIVDLKRVFYLYDVAFTVPGRNVTATDKPFPKGLTRALVQIMREKYPQVFAGVPIIHDGKANIFVHVRLRLRGGDGSDIEQTFPIERRHPIKGSVERFNVTLKMTDQEISLEEIVKYHDGMTLDMPVAEINVLDLLMSQQPSLNSRLAPVGRSFFIIPQDHDKDKAYLCEGRELWPGYNQSVRIVSRGCCTLNVLTTAKTFYREMNLAEFSKELLRLQDRDKEKVLREPQICKLRSALRGLKVYTTHNQNGRMDKKVTSVTTRSADTQPFPRKDGGRMIVSQHFKSREINLRYPKWPCVQFGKPDSNHYVPLELCTICPGQAGGRKMSDKVTADVIKKTALPPARKKQEILDTVRECGFNQDPYAQALGVKVNPNMMQVPARVLDPPTMTYGRDGRQEVRVSQGQWNISNRMFRKCHREIKAWAVISFDDMNANGTLDNVVLDRFFCNLKRAMKQCGMDVPEDRCLCEPNVRLDLYEKVIRHAEEKGCEFIFTILPQKNSEWYNKIKRLCNRELGVFHQNMWKKNVEKTNPGTIENICQKMNAKMGGINGIPRDDFVSQRIFNVPTIVFGADVNHPAPGDFSQPSIAAVVYSIDGNAVYYPGEARAQKHRQEIIEDLQEMVYIGLLAFFRNTGKKPERIVFYRDGVSESQFNQVLRIELPAIRKACLELERDGCYQPGITLLTVQKRHKTRFFPNDPSDGEGKQGNIRAGTVVDRDVTHPVEHDFYMAPHFGLQGTSRPTHFKPLYDDNKFTADDIQALTFYLAHVYSKCARSISNPAPAQYAHLRAKSALVHLPSDNGSEHSGSSCSSLGEPTDEMRQSMKVHAKLAKTMFYI